MICLTYVQGSVKRIASLKRGIKIKANPMFGNNVRLSKEAEKRVLRQTD